MGNQGTQFFFPLSPLSPFPLLHMNSNPLNGYHLAYACDSVSSRLAFGAAPLFSARFTVLTQLL